MAIKLLGDDWIEASQAAALFNLTERTVKNKAARGEIPGALIGRQWFFNIDILREFIKKQLDRKAVEKAEKEATKLWLSKNVAKPTGTISRSRVIDTVAQLEQLKKNSRSAMKMT